MNLQKIQQVMQRALEERAEELFQDAHKGNTWAIEKRVLEISELALCVADIGTDMKKKQEEKNAKDRTRRAAAKKKAAPKKASKKKTHKQSTPVIETPSGPYMPPERQMS